LDHENDLHDAVVAIGGLIGLLSKSNGTVSLNDDWFSDPVTELEKTGTRLHYLATLLGSVFTAVAEPPDVFPDAQWYPIPNPNTGGPTSLHVVASKGSDLTGQFGLGVLHPFYLGNLTIQAFVYVPLFSYDTTNGVEFITNSTTEPTQIGVYVTTSDKFQVDGVTFTALKIEAKIYLVDQAPTFAMTFENVLLANGSPACLQKDGTNACIYTTLTSLQDPTVLAWLGEVMVQGSYWLHLYIGDSPRTIGDLLTAANFLTKNENLDYDLNLKNLKAGAPKDIALNFLFAFLNGLADLNIPLITLPGGGIYIASENRSDNSTDYGVRLAIDIPLTSRQSETSAGNNSSAPTVDLCIGTWFTGETDSDNWMKIITKADFGAGATVFALNRTTAGDFRFEPSFKLASIGINIAGAGDAPLFNVNGFTLKGAELRGYLDSNGSLSPSKWGYGFAARLDDVAFPLGTSLNDAQQGSSSTNMVAKSLISSNGSKDDAQSSPLNPAFSAEAGYISPPASGGSYPPMFKVYDAQGVQTEVIWFPIQRRFGPINCQKIGVGIPGSDPDLEIIFDGGVSCGGLDIYLDQLSISADLKEITKASSYGIDLKGLTVTYSGAGVAISGGLLKTIDTQTHFIGYDGEAILQTENLALFALGSFGSLPGGGTSLFIFAMLDYPLGGPPFFFVTGLAAGFGYNRSLKIPAQSNVQQFPLLSLLSQRSPHGLRPEDVLPTLEQWVQPTLGEYWLAAGLQFTTFQIINTNAVLVVEFGKDFIISLLGLSTLKQPMSGDTYVYAELEIEVVVDPNAGAFKASAVLSPASYVFTSQVHLTGGFAFYSWFGSNTHKGDFAFTIGGYHPSFNVPDWYPKEPRVGINWPISDKILMNGEAYFAITPTAMMAGGGLALTFTDGPLKAWLKAQVDIILDWNPFYLDANASISVGVSYRVDCLFVHSTLSVEIGAAFHFYTPPVGGSVHVDWYIISFTINFGADPQPLKDFYWSDFKQILPKAKQSASKNANTNPSSSPPVECLHITAVAGLITTQTQGGMTLWIVRPGKFEFAVGSAIPSTSIVVQDAKPENNVTFAGEKVGIRRVNGGITPENYLSTQTVTILQLAATDISSINGCVATVAQCTTQPTNCAGTPVAVSGWQIKTTTQNLPQALWGSADPDINQPVSTVAGTMGVTMNPVHPASTNCTPEMVIDEIFKDRTVNAGDKYRMPLSQSQWPVDYAPQPVESFVDIKIVDDSTTVAQRNAVFLALQNLGVNGWTNERLPLMADKPGEDFADETMEGSPVQ
jgi:hypothetical protein